MGVIFLFIDGIGLAPESPQNPFSTLARDLPGLSALTGSDALTTKAAEITHSDHLFKPVDANLGIEGLPQSGTGQTALFTGVNAAEVIGKHFGPFPHSGNKPILRDKGLFKQAMAAGLIPKFMNAYPPVFFERARKTRRWSCSTLMVKSSGQKLSSTQDVVNGDAITAEFYGDYWREKLGIVLPERDGEAVADILIKAADSHDLVMMEYYLTDKAGHARDLDLARDVLLRLDRVLLPLSARLAGHTLVICSDHGNLENLGTKTHTRNPVPLIVKGPGAPFFTEAESITDVTSCIINAARNNYRPLSE